MIQFKKMEGVRRRIQVLHARHRFDKEKNGLAVSILCEFIREMHYQYKIHGLPKTTGNFSMPQVI